MTKTVIRCCICGCIINNIDITKKQDKQFIECDICHDEFYDEERSRKSKSRMRKTKSYN